MSPIHSTWHYYLPLILAIPLESLATTATTTVDDADPAITYIPSVSWSQGDGCTGCSIHPDPSEAYEGTWHDTTHTPGDGGRSFTYVFTGVAVQVFNIIVNNGVLQNSDTVAITDIILLIDGEQADTYTHIPDDTSNIAYNSLVLSKTGLSNTQHTLVVQASDNEKNLVLFDYLEYIQSTPDPPTSTVTTASTSTFTFITTVTDSQGVSTITSTFTSSSTFIPLTSTAMSKVSTSSVSTPTPTSTPTSSSAMASSAAVTSSLPASSAPITSSEAPQQSAGTAAAVAKPSSSSNLGTIVGAAAGGLAGLILLAFLAFCFARRRNRAPSVMFRGTGEKPRRYHSTGSSFFGAPQRSVASSASRLIVIGSGGTTGPSVTGSSESHAASEWSQPVSYFDNDIASTGLPLRTPSVSTVHARPLSSQSSLTAAAPSSFFLGGEPVGTTYRPPKAGPDQPKADVPPVSPLPETVNGRTRRRSSTYEFHAARALPPVPMTATAEPQTSWVISNAEDGSQGGARAESQRPSSLVSTGEGLRGKVAMLEQEVMRLRAQQDLQAMYAAEAPPLYGPA